MHHILTSCKRFIIITLASLMVLAPTSAPIAVSAADCAPAQAPAGTARPAGADSGTYHYTTCGYFENEHYTWNPATQDDTPKVQPTYTYNVSTKLWDAQIWQFSPARNDFYLKSVSVDQPPAGALTKGGPVETPAPTPAASAPTSESNVVADNKNQQTIDNKTSVGLNNTINSNATTGDATVAQNTKAGNATSGNAQAMANVINMLQSSNGGGQIATFTTNIDGDVQGDLIIDPSMLQPAADVSNTNDVDINIQNEGTINNKITLNAESGDATVTKNTQAGDAKSGNATAIANIVNMMNSMISANQSFMGVVNINGNFNGNILMPQSFLDQLIASNAPQSNLGVSQETINNYTANVGNKTAITNNITNTASSGNATVADNTKSGTAKTGAAETNVTVFDLTNNYVNAGNSMLVFVNVSGKWVGVLMDAPSGATAAAFGGGVTSRSTNNTTINAQNKGTINNDITVAAKTGDASVTKNTQAGYATSGDAKTAVNVANVSNSTLNLTGWFGILFINVFGNWNGNFGVATNLPATGAGAQQPGQSAGQQITPAAFGFTPGRTVSGSTTRTSAAPFAATYSNLGSAQNDEQQVAAAVNNVLGASSGIASVTKSAASTPAAQESNTNLFVLAGALLMLAILIIAVDRRKQRI